MNFFTLKQKELLEALENYFIPILDDENSAISLSNKISICVKDIYLTKCPMDLVKKTNFIELSDTCTVVNSRDNLNAQQYFLIDPCYTYTCKSDNDFLPLDMFGPTVAWEKGFWKDVLENLDNMEDPDKFDYKSINSCLNYICDAFTEFKKNNNEQEMKNILSELQKDISFFVNKWETNDFRRYFLYKIINLMNDKDIINLLDEKELKNWAELLNSNKIPLSSSEQLQMGRNVKQLIEDRLIQINMTNDSNLNKSTLNIMSTLTQNNDHSLPINNVNTNNQTTNNNQTEQTTSTNNAPPPPNEMTTPSSNKLRISQFVTKTTDTTKPNTSNDKNSNTM